MLAHVRRGGIAIINWYPHNPLTGGNAWDAKDSTVVPRFMVHGTGQSTPQGVDKHCVSIFS